MEFPQSYQIALNEIAIRKNFPHLENDFEYTSLRTDEYNCIAWISGIENDWEQLYDANGNLIRDSDNYIQLFRNKGFELTIETEFDASKLRIAIYIDTSITPNHFKHVAKQLNNTAWTSKMGDWEDIRHSTPEVLKGGSYGDRIIYMEKFIGL